MNATNNNLTPWLTEKFISAAPLAAAKALGGLATHEAVLLIKPLKAESMVACLNPMDASKAAAILRRLPSRQAAHVLARLDLVQAGAIYKAFSVPQREKMKTLLAVSLVKTLEANTAWAANSAGAQMSRDFVAFKTENKVAEMIEKLKTLPRKKLPAACLVVAAKDGKLKGIVRSAELAFFSENSLAGSIMSEVKSVPPQTDAQTVREILLQGQPLVAVVDADNVPLGVLSLAELSTEKIKRKKKFGWF
ncbi:MAG: magnesium transporter [Elusimicrobiaceae bacterium]|nr:magnesium transporter [Elusimicrobiaceae bacterium]